MIGNLEYLYGRQNTNFSPKTIFSEHEDSTSLTGQLQLICKKHTFETILAQPGFFKGGDTEATHQIVMSTSTPCISYLC